MLKEESTTVKIKVTRKKIQSMLTFLTLTLFVYIFHIVQSAVFYRTYITAFSLFIVGFGTKYATDESSKMLWECSLVWFTYSILFFDIRSHITKLYWVIALLYAIFPILSIQKIYGKKFGIYLRLLYFSYVCFTPSLYANVYGNALYSIIKLLSMQLIITTSENNLKGIENYIWPAFAHPIVLLFVPIQVVINVMSIMKKSSSHKQLSQEREKKKTSKNRVISEADVPFFFNDNTV